VRINQLGKAFTPIGSDVEIVEEGEFFFGFHTNHTAHRRNQIED
jgi:hypothetical protein